MNRVYLGRLPNRAQDRDIDKFFKGFGKITDIMLKSGFAFIEFENKRDADDAVHELNGQMLCGERVIVEHAKGTPRGEDFRRDLQKGYPIPSSRYSNDRRGSPPSGRTYRLIVKNLSSKVSWQDLKDVMRKAGEVIYADAHKERKNEGVVEYMSHREVKKAIDRLDGMELCGRKIELVEDSSNNRGDGDRKRSRSRSGSSKRRSGRRKRRTTSDSRSRSRSHDRRRKVRDDSASPPRRNRNKSDSASPVADKRKRTERKRSGSSEKRSRSRSGKRSRSSTKRSRSPSKKRSRSLSKEKSLEKKDRSPSEKKSRSPSEKKSRSPSEKKSRSPSEKRSRSRSVGRKSKGESSGEESEGEKK